MSFKYYLENYCAELDGDFSKHKEDILDFFYKFKDSSQYTIGRHDAFVVDLLMHNKYYHELYKILKQMFDDSKMNIKFDEISHLFRIVFLQIKPNDVLYPHTDYRLRCQCCVNIPLTDNCSIDFYEKPTEKADNTNYDNFKRIDTLNYTNPIILNTNSWHGVRNNTDRNRLILKVNFPITPWKMLIDSCSSQEQLKLWDTQMPWEQENVQEQLL